MNIIKKIKNYYNWGKRYLTDPYQIKVASLNKKEIEKKPTRSEVINFILDSLNRSTHYLEIGVRNPAENFDKIKAKKKYSVDPGIEFKENPVDFKMTSDDFFLQLKSGKILNKTIQFDVIFIDGLHLAEQADRDIHNAIDFIKNDGFVVIHDCNPPSEWHAREEHNYRLSPAKNNWNGTTWKAFYKWRCNSEVYSCCVDTDWGVGVLSKKLNIGMNYHHNNEFFDFSIFDKKRIEYLNLLSFEEFKNKFKNF